MYWPRDSWITQFATLDLDRSTTVGIQHRPLNWSHSQLTYFEIILRKTSTAERHPEHGASTPEVSFDIVGVGKQDEGVSGRGVILITS